MFVPQFRVFLFDVDGSLVDSASDICGAIPATPGSTRQHEVSDEFLRGYIGRHLIDLFQDLLPEYSRDQMDALVVDYRRIYWARNHTGTSVYPGVAEALAELPGRKSTAATKGTPTTPTVLEVFGLL